MNNLCPKCNRPLRHLLGYKCYPCSNHKKYHYYYSRPKQPVVARITGSIEGNRICMVCPKPLEKFKQKYCSNPCARIAYANYLHEKNYQDFLEVA